MDTYILRRLVIVTGDKGGVGKSMFARGLVQLYINGGLSYKAYDADSRNPQLYRHYKNTPASVTQVDIFTRGEADILLADLDEHRPNLALLDLPSQSGKFFEDLVKEFDLFNTLSDLGYQITLVSVISRLADSISILDHLYTTSGDTVQHVVVKNLFFGEEDKFERYDGNQIRKRLIESGRLQEISMPDLFYKTFDFIDLHNLDFGSVASHQNADLAIRSRTKSWLKHFELSSLRASYMLGLTNMKPT